MLIKGTNIFAAPALEQVEERAVAAFQERFGRAPTTVTRAPGRVNLIGDHTDYNDGFVMPIAIEQYCVAAGTARPGASRSRLYAADLGESLEVDLRSPKGTAPNGEVGGWSRYVIGTVAQFGPGGLGHRLQNLDLTVASSVAIGAGLSSSAALEVSVAVLMARITGARLSPLEMARLCQRAEHQYAGVPCGIMDQMISTQAKADHALLIDCRSFEPTPIPVGDDVIIAVVDSGVRHSLASSAYAQRRQSCDAAAQRLGVASLRDATPELLRSRASSLEGDQEACARHVIGENARTQEAAQALTAGDFDRVGRLMYESHASLRDDYRVSCPELDTLVEIAGGVDGVWGARMTGGGFGGCVVALVRPDAAQRLERSLREGFAGAHGRECTMLTTRPVDGAILLNGL